MNCGCDRSSSRSEFTHEKKYRKEVITSSSRSEFTHEKKYRKEQYTKPVTSGIIPWGLPYTDIHITQPKSRIQTSYFIRIIPPPLIPITKHEIFKCYSTQILRMSCSHISKMESGVRSLGPLARTNIPTSYFSINQILQISKNCLSIIRLLTVWSVKLFPGSSTWLLISGSSTNFPFL